MSEEKDSGTGTGTLDVTRGTSTITRTPGPMDVGQRLTHGTEVLDHERLDVFRVARDCFSLVMPWLSRKMPASARDQLDRSLSSIVANIAEGAGKTSLGDKRRSYEIAKGSTLEAAAQLEMLKMRGTIDASEYSTARRLLVRVVQMLCRMAGAPRSTQ